MFLIVLCFITGFLHARVAPTQNSSLPSFHYMQSVSTAQFRPLGQAALTQPFVINTPGIYTFVQDIGHANVTTDSKTLGAFSAIYINCNNVVIDLAGRTLYQANATPNIHGIEIAPNVHNITIKNGNIADFNGYGILVRDSVDNLRLDGLNINHTSNNGIGYLGLSGKLIKNSVISNCIVSAVEGAKDIVNAISLRITYGQSIAVYNSVFSGNQPVDSTNAYGVLLENCSNITFEQCDASNHSARSSYGFAITNGSTSCSFIECTAHGNVGSDKTSGIGSGFLIDNSSACLLSHSYATNNIGTQAGYGFKLTKGTFNSIQDCQSFYNMGGSVGKTIESGGYGFCSTIGQGNIFTSCVTGGNQGDLNNATSIGAGFFLSGEIGTSLIEVESSNNGLITSLSYAAGIYLYNNSSQNIIRTSRTYNNLSKSSGLAYGVKDDATPSTSLFTDCIAFGNLSADNIASNYAVTYTRPDESFHVNTTVSTGTLKDLTTISPFQNISIIAR